MSRVYCPRHTERTVLYRVLFHYFEPFLLAGLVSLVIPLLTVSWQAVKVATANPAESLRYE